jgi:hypothetical protein
MRRLVRPLILCLACLSGAGCQAVSPPGKGVADAGEDAGHEDAGLDGGGACVADGESCAEGATCCDELVCLSLNDGPLLCHAPCSEHTDCGSGCCVDVRMGGAASQKLCGEAEICFPNGCEPEGGESCGSDAPCCAGLLCVGGATPEARNGCRQSCASSDDCESGCCVPLGNRDGGFCDEAIYCACIELGETCPDSGRTCCEASRCARFGDDPFSCLATCESDEDCGGNCCSAVSNGASVCAPFPC